MKIRVPEYFKDFKCIASKCEDTCCAGWGIVIDDATYDRYKNVQGECIMKSPLGDPIAYMIKGATIAIRNEDSSKIFVSLL